jgi:hypothetical protein
MFAKDEIARRLAESHSIHEPSLTRIVRFVSQDEDRPDEPIKLVEVNAEAVESGVMPVHFGPSGMIPYPSVVVELTPSEYDALQSNQLSLPSDWRPGEELFTRTGG